MVEKEEAMSWWDAARVSSVLMIAQIFIVFLPGRNFSDFMSNFSQCMFELVVFGGQTFFANFIALAGLSMLSSKKSDV